MKTNLSLLLIRVAFGLRLILGTADNVFSWERMLEFETFLAAAGFPLPLVCAVISVYAQFLAGISWLLGVQVKIASLLMIVNFLVALIGAHLLHGDAYLNLAPALHLLVISIVLYLLGPGDYTVAKISGRAVADPD